MRKTISLFGALVAALLVPTGVGADITYPATAICRGRSSAWESALIADGYGRVTDSSTTDEMLVSCSVPRITAADTNDDFIVYYYDGNSTTAKNVSCSVLTCDITTASCSSTAVRYGSSTAGGSLSDPGVHTSSSSPFPYLQFDNLTQDYAAGTSTSVNCQIPRLTGGNYSYIFSVNVNED